MKTCSKCKRDLPLDAFGKLSSSRDGLNCACKECCREAVKRAKAKHGKYRYKEAERAYDARPHRREALRKRCMQHRRERPEQYLAIKAVFRAVQRGLLKKQPCEKCGAERVEGHHDDYSKPLQVRWLCPSHHRQLHAALRRATA